MQLIARKPQGLEGYFDRIYGAIEQGMWRFDEEEVSRFQIHAVEALSKIGGTRKKTAEALARYYFMGGEVKARAIALIAEMGPEFQTISNEADRLSNDFQKIFNFGPAATEREEAVLRWVQAFPYIQNPRIRSGIKHHVVDHRFQEAYRVLVHKKRLPLRSPEQLQAMLEGPPSAE